MPRVAVVTLILIVLGPAASGKRNDDVVVMKNGDRFTGEIKRLEEGKLIFSASYMKDNVSLDWRQVDRLESKDLFNVYLTSGGVHTGVVTKTSQPGGVSSFVIDGAEFSVEVDRGNVVVVRPVEDSVWKQLTGSIDYGYSFTGGNNSTTQSSLSASVAYRVDKWSLQTNGSSVFNSQSAGSSTGRNTFSVFYARKLADRWYAGVLSEVLNSRQQDLALRTTAGGGLGRVLVRTEHSALGILSGVLFSRERYTNVGETQPNANNLEALFHLKYEMYTFKKVGIQSVVYAYPSLTDQGRIRMGLQPELGIELFRNFKWKFSLYENFDSRPPVHAPRNDFGTSTSIGWTF